MKFDHYFMSNNGGRDNVRCDSRMRSQALKLEVKINSFLFIVRAYEELIIHPMDKNSRVT